MERFSNKDLRNMIIPLFIEQALVMLVGILDTFFVAKVSEPAIAGVSLVNQFNTIFIYLFTALASGGAVVVSQYIGSQKNKKAGEASSQLLMFSTLFSFLIMVIVLLTYQSLLSLLFGKVTLDVMKACWTYIVISAYSYPALAIYNAGAAHFRSLGKTNTTMTISMISNVINVIGNYMGVFILRAGVAGVAYPSLIARIFSAIAITYLCFKEKGVKYKVQDIFKWNSNLLKKILSIAIPNGAENGVFQLVKVALSSIVAMFGTYQIAANGVAQSIWSLAALAGSAFGPVFITVIGQCMGAKDIEGATYYFKKLLKICVVVSIVWNALVFLITPFLLKFYSLTPETISLVITLVLIHNIFNAIVFPFSGSLGNGLRAAGDVKFTMIISIISTVVVRFALSYVLGVILNLGVIGIALAMCADWSMRGIIFIYRFYQGKWKEFSVI